MSHKNKSKVQKLSRLEVERLAQSACKEKLQEYSISPEIKKRLVLGTTFDKEHTIFELYIPGSKPEDAQLVVSTKVNVYTGKTDVQVFLDRDACDNISQTVEDKKLSAKLPDRDIEKIAQALSRETLKNYRLPNKKLKIQEYIYDYYKLFDVYVENSEKELKKIIATVKVNTYTGEATIEVFLESLVVAGM